MGTGPKRIWLFVWAVVAALVMISRMYLGAHSLDQIVLGGLLGLAFLIYYKYFLRELLYQAIQNILNNRHKQFYFIVNTIFFIIFLVLPIIVYEISSQSLPPVNSTYLNNIQIGCGKTVTSNYLLEKGLKGNILGFIAIGLMYGLLMLTNKHNQDVLYLTGHWNFRENICALYLFLTVLVVIGIPGVILGIVIPLLITSPIVGFISLVLAAIWSSFALVYILSKVQNKYRWIAYESPSNQN